MNLRKFLTFFWEMHHAMYDANAMSSLLQDIEQAHRGVSLPSPSDFAPFLGYMLSTDPQGGRRLLQFSSSRILAEALH